MGSSTLTPHDPVPHPFHYNCYISFVYTPNWQLYLIENKADGAFTWVVSLGVYLVRDGDAEAAGGRTRFC